MLSEDFVGDSETFSGRDDSLCFQLNHNLLLYCREWPGAELGLRVPVSPGHLGETGIWYIDGCHHSPTD